MRMAGRRLLALSVLLLSCDLKSAPHESAFDEALEDLVPGAHIGSTYGEATRSISSLQFVPNTSTAPGGEVPNKRMGFVRYSLRLDLPSYESAPDSAESVRWIEIWSTSRLSSDSVVERYSRTLGVPTDTTCLEFQGRPGYEVIRWLSTHGSVLLETPLRDDVNYSRLVFFRGAWSSTEYHRGERSTKCRMTTQ